MKRKELRILVVDKGGRGRERAICEAFVGAGAESYLVDQRGRWACADWDDADAFPDEFALVVVHGHDIDEWESLNRSTTATVRFSGGGAPEAVPDGEYWIQRSIMTSADAITPAEAKELVAWVSGGCQDNEIPSLLRKPNAQETLAALSILCQGCLAVHAQPGSARADDGVEPDGSTKQTLEEALASMGWSSVDPASLDAALGTPEARARLRVKTLETRWWKDGIFPEIEDLRQSILNEWGSEHEEQRKKVEDLVEELGGPQVHLGTVAEAYLALAWRLGDETDEETD